DPSKAEVAAKIIGRNGNRPQERNVAVIAGHQFELEPRAPVGLNRGDESRDEEQIANRVQVAQYDHVNEAGRRTAIVIGGNESVRQRDQPQFADQSHNEESYDERPGQMSPVSRRELLSHGYGLHQG